MSLCLSGLILIHACTKDEPLPNGSGTADPVLVACLMVGQESRYIRFTGDQYFNNGNDQITYHADTLVLSVTSEDQGVFTLSETLTPYSQSVLDGSLLDADSVYVFQASLEADTLWLEPVSGDFAPSRLFGEVTRRGSIFDYLHSYLPTSSFAGPAVTFSGWKTTLPYQEVYKEAHMEPGVLLGETYPFLNARVANESMAFDGPGYTVIWEPKGRIVRTSVVNWWTQSGGGWDLLP